MNDQISTVRRQLTNGQGQGGAPAARAGLLARLFGRPQGFVRRHERFPCCVIAVLDIIDKDVPVDGLVTEISEGGLLFRPASRFIFDRTGSAVTVRFSDDQIAGVIVNVKPQGYGVRFLQGVDDARIQSILAQYGLPLEAAG